MRAFPADSLEYFGDTAVGNTALPAAAGAAAAGAAALGGVVPVVAGGAAGAVVVASVPHSALRKAFHVIPLSVPAACAALYFALHSCIVSACAAGATVMAATKAATHMTAQRIIMIDSPLRSFRVTDFLSSGVRTSIVA